MGAVAENGGVTRLKETEMQDFRKIRAWQKGHDLTLDVYAATAEFPMDERFGLRRELRRSAWSIPSNIAEGCGRESAAQLAAFIDIARGSAFELDYQLQLAAELGFLPTRLRNPLDDRLQSLKRDLTAFYKVLRR